MKKFLIAAALLGMTALGGCTTDQVQATKTEYEAIVPPDQLYQCPKTPARPAEPVTDKKVAEFIVKLDKAHSICSHSLSAIKAFASQAKLSVEQNQPR